MKAIMYGGGNIGRGFIGPLFRAAGYEVIFIDVQADLVETLNARHAYPLRIISDGGHEDFMIEGISAINGMDAEAVSDAIAAADICATAVGANILGRIAPNLAAGIRKRFHGTDSPLNIIICENLLDADKILSGMVQEDFTEEERALCGERIGFVEASIGRMVPVQTEEMKDGDPLRVCVERYGNLPVDKDAFKGPIPTIGNMIPFSPFGFYIERKLYVHNMGHAVCAYLGLIAGYEYIFQAIDDAEIRLIAENGMLETARGLAAKYGVDLADLLPHVINLLGRFGNRALKDTCARVGGDPVRKLARGDRLIGASLMCEGQGITPDYVGIGVAAALYQFLQEAGREQNTENAAAALRELSGVGDGDGTGNTLVPAILEDYQIILDGGGAQALRRLMDRRAAARAEDIV
ncbi:mannitol-1-phosphate 5-dehydrogenase [Clostridia bacterium]|nr:mannitol-1-phosphate 5-dehydrogenase [Clostridia bacterium]